MMKEEEHPAKIIDSFDTIKIAFPDATLNKIICDFTTESTQAYEGHLKGFHNVDLDNVKNAKSTTEPKIYVKQNPNQNLNQTFLRIQPTTEIKQPKIIKLCVK